MPSYTQALGHAGIDRIGGIPVPDWSLPAALAFMDHKSDPAARHDRERRAKGGRAGRWPRSSWRPDHRSVLSRA